METVVVSATLSTPTAPRTDSDGVICCQPVPGGLQRNVSVPQKSIWLDFLHGTAHIFSAIFPSSSSRKCHRRGGKPTE